MPMETPIDPVIMMRGQGLSNNQIVQNLQRAGYSIDQINNAISQADIKEGIVATPFQLGTAPASSPLQPYPPAYGGSAPVSYGGGVSGMSQQASGGGESGVMADERIQEIAEAIIDEKWSELIANVNKILEWKDATESRMARMEQEIKDMKDSFDRLHEGVLGKIGEYDHGLQDIGTEIKALEKVFQKILPGFIENVSELSRITQQVKKGQQGVGKKI